MPNILLYENGKTYDASLLIQKDGTIAGVQKMVHIAQAEQFYEQDYYTPSDDGFHVFDTEYGKIGIVVCFDRHYPESIRTESLMGAELILIPTVNTKTSLPKCLNGSCVYRHSITVRQLRCATASARRARWTSRGNLL